MKASIVVALVLALGCVAGAPPTPTTGVYNVKLKEGCDPEVHLSSRACGAARVGTWPIDDGSRHQHWQLARLDGRSGSLLGVPITIKSGCSKYVSTPAEVEQERGCSAGPVTLSDGAASWELEPDGQGSYRIALQARAGCEQRYLGLPARCVGSAPPSVGLYQKDDPAVKALWEVVQLAACPHPPPAMPVAVAHATRSPSPSPAATRQSGEAAAPSTVVPAFRRSNDTRQGGEGAGSALPCTGPADQGC